MSNEPDVIVVVADENLTVVDVVASDPVMAVDVTTGPAVEVVEVNTGLQGPVGPPGPSGPPGSGGFVFIQSTPSVTWVIDYDPALVLIVTVFDTAGTQVEGDVNTATPGQFVITFSSAFAGKAICS